jgi:hypothetical protein
MEDFDSSGKPRARCPTSRSEASGAKTLAVRTFLALSMVPAVRTTC